MVCARRVIRCRRPVLRRRSSRWDRLPAVPCRQITPLVKCGVAECPKYSALAQFQLDLGRDPRTCPKCTSAEVRSVRELIDKPCPRCRVGIIVAGSPVRWKLDEDWEQLPVPQIVKDMVQYANDRVVPDSLRTAHGAASRLGEHNFFVVVVRLLNWWEGSKDRGQRESEEMRPKWTWCKVLPAVLETTPMLGALLSIYDGRCWFASQVSPDVRRGIMNYVRKYREHVVWT
jgi:hypothetical protein